MLRANSKIVRQKIRQLIIDNYNDKANDVDNWYDYKVGADFNYICKWILQEFIVAEFGFTNEDIKKDYVILSLMVKLSMNGVVDFLVHLIQMIGILVAIVLLIFWVIYLKKQSTKEINMMKWTL